jgi:hypothetical protein
MLFGSEETIHCIHDLPIPGPKGEQVCLGHKITVTWVGAPAFVTDDGYVLARSNLGEYYPLPKELIGKLQAEGALPTPLPRYSISVGEYVLGYSLWWILPVVILASVITRRRLRGLPIDGATMPPIATEPPILKTPEDQYIASQVALQLRPREKVTHQAFAKAADVGQAAFTFGVKGYFAALTDQRLILIETRPSVFGPRLENRGHESIERPSITKVEIRGTALRIHLRDGNKRVLGVEVKRRRFSNQVAFLLDLPRLLGLGAEVAAAPLRVGPA